MNSITLRNVSKTFILPKEKRDTLREHAMSFFRKREMERFHALKDISFEVQRGEFLGVIGSNGSGKSTLLKILAGIYLPDKGGEVSISGRLAPFLELGAGFHHELSARENVYLNGTLLGLTKEYLDSHFEQIIAFAELEEFTEQKLKYFSSGMQVRLAFSVAMHSDSEIYLLDEVLAVGDASFQEKCFREFEKLKAAGKTIVLVTHDLGAVEKFATRVIYIRDGEIAGDGEAKKVVGEYLAKEGSN